MLTLRNPTGRNTQAYILTLDDGTTLYFSYQTCIAIWKGDLRLRLPNNWGPTTGRHFNELGCSHFDIVDELPILSVTAKGG